MYRNGAWVSWVCYIFGERKWQLSYNFFSWAKLDLFHKFGLYCWCNSWCKKYLFFNCTYSTLGITGWVLNNLFSYRRVTWTLTKELFSCFLFKKFHECLFCALEIDCSYLGNHCCSSWEQICFSKWQYSPDKARSFC